MKAKFLGIGAALIYLLNPNIAIAGTNYMECGVVDGERHVG